MSEQRPVLTQINLVAHDFDASAAFYRLLGLELPDRSAPQLDIRHAAATGSDACVLELDNENLAARYNSSWRRPTGGARLVLGFSFTTRAAVDSKYAQLVAAGHEGRQAPYDAFFGVRYAVVADPDGNDVGLMSPVDDAMRSWPPADAPNTCAAAPQAEAAGCSSMPAGGADRDMVAADSASSARARSAASKDPVVRQNSTVLPFGSFV
jgi:uncharacterized glyoxalase superfamily protein PhnB